MAPYQSPVFAQSLDDRRPHTLLTTNVLRAGSLQYRYDDTGETVLVPHIWYNQTYSLRVEAVRQLAVLRIKSAQKIRKCPPLGMTQAKAQEMAVRLDQYARRINEEADRIQAAGDPKYPVASARLRLDFGEI